MEKRMRKKTRTENVNLIKVFCKFQWPEHAENVE